MNEDVEYPKGCLPIENTLNVTQQVERLRCLYDSLYDCQENTHEEVNNPKRFAELFNHLSQDCFLDNSNTDFRFYLSLCLTQILRLFKPDLPTTTPVELKDVYLHIFRTLRGLGETTTDNPRFQKYFVLVKTISEVCGPLSDMRNEDEQEALIVIKCLLNNVLAVSEGKAWQKNLADDERKMSKQEDPSSSESQEDDDEGAVEESATQSIRNMFVDIIKNVLDMDYVPNEIIDIILSRITIPQRNHAPEARSMIESIIYKCMKKEIDEHALITAIRNLMTVAVKEGKFPEDFLKTGTENRHKLFDLVRYLHYISQELVSGAVEEMKFWLQSENPQYRREAVKIVGMCTRDKHCQFGMDENDATWTAFMNSSIDPDETVRYEFVEQSVHILISNHSHLRGQIINALLRLSHDVDDEVRLRVVSAVTDVAKSKLEAISDKLLKLCAGRFRDKKPKVRNLSIKLMMELYHHVMTSKPTIFYGGDGINSGRRTDDAALPYTESDKDCVRFIPNDVFNIVRLAQRTPAFLDSRLLIERYIQMYFIPFQTEAKKRVRIMADLYRNLNDMSRMMFADVINRSSQLRRAMIGLLSLIGTSKDMGAEGPAQVRSRIHKISLIFPESATLEKVMMLLVNQLGLEAETFDAFKKLMADRVTTQESVTIALSFKSQMEKKLSGKNHQTIFRQFIDRVIPLSFDVLAAKELINLVAETVTAKIDQKSWGQKYFEHDMELLKLFSDHFAHTFADEETVERIRDKILNLDEPTPIEVALHVLSKIFANSGFRQKLDDEANRKEKWFLATGMKLKEFVMRDERELRHSCKLATRLVASFLGKEKAVEFFDTQFDELYGRLYLQHEGAANAFQVLAEIFQTDVAHYFTQIMQILESDKIGPMLLSSPDHSNDDPIEFNDSVHFEKQPWPKLTAAKVYSAKFTAKVLCAMHQNTKGANRTEIEAVAQKFIDILDEIVDKKGELSEKQCELEKARLRATAAGCLLKISIVFPFRSKINPGLLRKMSYMIADEAYCVRFHYAKHVKKGLDRRLPIEFAACYGLINLGLTDEEGHNKLEGFKTICMNQAAMAFAERTEERANVNNLQGPQRVMFCSETVIAYVVWLLANNDRLEKVEDNAGKNDSEEVLAKKAANVNVLAELQECLWFVIDSLRNSKCNMQKVWQILEKLKTCGDKPMRESRTLRSTALLDHNKKIWAICDLGITMMLYRAKLQMEDRESRDLGLNLQFFYICEKNKFDPSNVYAPDILINTEKQRNGRLPKPGHVFHIADITAEFGPPAQGNDSNASTSSKNVSKRNASSTSVGGKRAGPKEKRKSGIFDSEDEGGTDGNKQSSRAKKNRGADKYDLPFEEDDNEVIRIPKRRGAPTARRVLEEEEDDMAPVSPPTKRRGATSRASNRDDEVDEMRDDTPPPRRQGRRSKASAREEVVDEMRDDTPPPKRRGGNPKKQIDEMREDTPPPRPSVKPIQSSASTNGASSSNGTKLSKNRAPREKIGLKSSKRDAETEKESDQEEEEERIDDVSLDNLIISPILNESSGRARRSARTIAATATITASTPLVVPKPKTVKRKRVETDEEEHIHDEEVETQEPSSSHKRTSGRRAPSTPRAKRDPVASVDTTDSVEKTSPAKKASSVAKQATKTASRSSARSSLRSPTKSSVSNGATPNTNKYGLPMEEDETPSTSGPSVRSRTSARLSKK